MSAVRIAPLSDRTLSSAQQLNVANNTPQPTSTKKQNNPYAGCVLPSPIQQAMLNRGWSTTHEQIVAPSPPPPTAPVPKPQTFSRNPYADARSVLQTPQQITRMYVDGRPVPVKKTSPPPPNHTVASVKVSFRRHTGFYLMNLSLCMTPVTSLEHLVGVHVIVDGDRGEDMGCIVTAAEVSEREREHTPRVRRVATATDLHHMNHVLPAEERKALELAREEATRVPQGEMLEITDAVFQFDQKKLTLMYRFPGRIYFVPLSRALNQVYRCRIWMQREGESRPYSAEEYHEM